MKTTVSIIRIAILMVITCAATLLLFSEEQDEKLGVFLLHIFIDKAASIGIFLTGIALYNRWAESDPLISRLDKIMGGEK